MEPESDNEQLLLLFEILGMLNSDEPTDTGALIQLGRRAKPADDARRCTFSPVLLEVMELQFELNATMRELDCEPYVPPNTGNLHDDMRLMLAESRALLDEMNAELNASE